MFKKEYAVKNSICAPECFGFPLAPTRPWRSCAGGHAGPLLRYRRQVLPRTRPWCRPGSFQTQDRLRGKDTDVVTSFFFRFCLFLFRGSARGKERNVDRLPPACPQTGSLAAIPGTCPNWEGNQRPFGLQDNTQPTEPPQAG